MFLKHWASQAPILLSQWHWTPVISLSVSLEMLITSWEVYVNKNLHLKKIIHLRLQTAEFSFNAHSHWLISVSSQIPSMTLLVACFLCSIADFWRSNLLPDRRTWCRQFHVAVAETRHSGGISVLAEPFKMLLLPPLPMFKGCSASDLLLLIY